MRKLILFSTIAMLTSCNANSIEKVRELEEFKPPIYNEETYLILYKDFESKFSLKNIFSDEVLGEYNLRIEQVNEEGTLLNEYKLENINLDFADINQNRENNDILNILDLSHISDYENYAYNYLIKEKVFEKVNREYDIVSMNYIGDRELHMFLMDNHNAGVIDTVTNKEYGSIENFTHGATMVDFKGYIIVETDYGLKIFDKETMEEILFTTDNFNKELIVNSDSSNKELYFPKLVMVYDDKLLFQSYSNNIKEEYRRGIFTLDKNLNAQYFCDIAESSLELTSFETLILDEDKVLINFYSNYEPGVDKNYYSTMYILDLENKSYELLNKEYIGDNLYYNLLYINEDNLYIQESDISTIDPHVQYMEKKNKISAANDKYTESILIIDLETLELKNRIPIRKDDSRGLNERIFLPY